ncbi:MAG: S-adenosyl-l-methionine hydroxide adenosyltransferase family protein [Sphaerochaetaceae bacterium]|nr:S-adenosyl-l-methionine hydroxide adenosyltransferase family protein [Sphaerochaetaceae bacterium]
MSDKAEEIKALAPWEKRQTVVFMSDFGLADGAVCAMHGVADAVCHELRLEDLTHYIPQFNIWEASYRLIQALTYWAPGTVFVSVVDPGVGSDRESVAVLTVSGHIIVTPDNGTLSHVAKNIGILERRRISETENRLSNSQRSYTFYGRDVYAYTGARLAAGIIGFDEVGPLLEPSPVMLSIEDPEISGDIISGTIDVLDTRYGSLWTNIPDTMFTSSGIKYGDNLYVTVTVRNRVVFGSTIRFCKNFTEVPVGETLVYINSLLNAGVALNQGSFAQTFGVGSGEDWKISFRKIR